MTFEELDQGLENWRNHYRDRKVQRVTFSLEGKYRPERKDMDYEEDLLPAPSKPVNVAQAIIFEKAITQLPFKFEACLVIDYMYRWALADRVFNKTCRIAKTSPRDWDSNVRTAKLMLLSIMSKNV